MAPSYVSQTEPERRNWPNKLDYHLTLFSQALGLCSFWRFPYLAYENNGAPFVYVFLLLYMLVGVPLVFLEMAWGQYSNLAPLQGFSIIPTMQGVGGCMVLLSTSVIIYFGIASYYLLMYLIASLADPLPYSSCGNEWNTLSCQENLEKGCSPTEANSVVASVTTDGLVTNVCNYTNGPQTTPAIEYWQYNLATNAAVCRNLPGLSDIITGSSTVLLLPAIAAGIFVLLRLLIAFFSLLSGVRFTGKVAYVLCTIPFAVSVMLLVRCVTLTNASNGITHLFVLSDLEGLISPKVWKDAIGQVFLSLLVTWGGLCTWSSYNRFYNRYELDASILITTVPILSFMSAVSMFGVVGFLSHVRDVSFENALNGTKGPLAPFVAYSEAMSHMWGNPVPWSIIVYISLFVLSTAAILPGIECLVSSVSDSLTLCRSIALRIVSVFLVVTFTLTVYYGVPCIIEGSALQYFEFFDTLTFPISCILIALPELLMITFAFGVQLLRTNIKAMTNNTCLKRLFWPVMWGGVTPFILLICLVYSVYGAVTNGIQSLAPTIPPGIGKIGDPTGWTMIATLCFISVLFLSLLITAICKIARARGSCLERLRDASTPAALGRSSVHTNGGGRSRSNGDVYMADYIGHQDTNEILIDDDIVTTV